MQGLYFWGAYLSYIEKQDKSVKYQPFDLNELSQNIRFYPSSAKEFWLCINRTPRTLTKSHPRTQVISPYTSKL